jgi:hypothetical protein
VRVQPHFIIEKLQNFSCDRGGTGTQVLRLPARISLNLVCRWSQPPEKLGFGEIRVVHIFCWMLLYIRSLIHSPGYFFRHPNSESLMLAMDSSSLEKWTFSQCTQFCREFRIRGFYEILWITCPGLTIRGLEG